MSKFTSEFFSFPRLTSIFGGLLLTALCSLYFFNVSAETKIAEKPAEQNLLNGRLAFSRITAPPTTANIITSNPDGSDQSYIANSLTPTEPAWSPDGTKLAYAAMQSPYDIYVVNAVGGEATNLTNSEAPIQERNPSWSVTGKIAYERSNTNGSNRQIWTMNADGTGQAQFTAITQPSPISPAWSPDGTKLAFESERSIWIINADGTNAHRITTTVGYSNPAWSPDGNKIAAGKGYGVIAVFNSDGTNETLITTSGGAPSSGYAPAWSPDGTKIAFALSSSTGGVYTMDTNGENQVRIVSNSTSFPNCCDVIFDNPAWQPFAQSSGTFNITGSIKYNNIPVVGATVNLSGSTNAAVTTDAVGNYQFSNLPAGGNYIVSPSFLRHYFAPANRSFNNLSSNQSGNFEVTSVCVGGKCVKNGKIAYFRNNEIYTINPDGTGNINITNNTATDGEPNYSPDGSNIIFSTNRDGNFEIYRMNADGSNLVRLTNNTTADSFPYYTPDGASIIFVSERDGNKEIYKMNADGTSQVRLTDNTASDTTPSVSSDGQKIVFISGRDSRTKIYSMNIDGTNQQILSDYPGFAPCYDRPSYSPDGFKIIFGGSVDCGTTHPSVWTMDANGSNRSNLGIGRFPIYSPDGMNTVGVCCYFSASPVSMSIGSLNGGSGRTFPIAFAPYDNVFPDWQGFRVPYAPFDFDGDGRSDISVFRPSNGAWYLQRSTAGLWVPVWGLPTDVIVPADYDGDQKTDVAVWRPSDNNFYILNSFDGTVRVENFGLSGDIPTGGDWDGDGKADLAVYRAGAQSIFYYRGSMGNPQRNITSVPWGISGDKPVVGDYDGDGRTDAAVYRNGDWYVRQSSNGQLFAVNFGLTNDKTVPADYDGDGKTDIAVYRDGIWYQLRSAQGFTAFQFGIANDVPAAADYDGDGRTDAAIYRDGVWWILKSQTSAVEAFQFGINTDKPISSVFVR